MRAIFRKEIIQFFSSLTGYLSVGVFLLVLGLFNWVFPETAIPDFGYAQMDGFFGIAPYVLIFLIPAICMRSFSEEMQSGTLELLITKPVTETDIILGKLFAAFCLVVLSILPTLTYVVSLWLLAIPTGNIDLGGIAGSYLGLLLLSAVFCSIGIFASSLTQNQISAYILGVFICFFLFIAFEYLAQLSPFLGTYDYAVEQFGLQAHFEAMSRGVMDSRDLVHFLCTGGFFVFLTRLNLQSRTW